MDKKLIAQLQIISPEEQEYLDGNIHVKKDIYTHRDISEVDCSLLLRNDKLVTVRPHSRFVEFPPHKHNYIEIMYVCQGTITHYIEGKELVMHTGDLLLLNQHVKHGIKRAEYDDIGIDFIALPEFFDIPLHMMKENNVIAEFLVSIFRQKNPGSHYLLFELKKEKNIENLMENMIRTILYEDQDEDASESGRTGRPASSPIVNTHQDDPAIYRLFRIHGRQDVLPAQLTEVHIKPVLPMHDSHFCSGENPLHR